MKTVSHRGHTQNTEGIHMISSVFCCDLCGYSSHMEQKGGYGLPAAADSVKE